MNSFLRENLGVLVIWDRKNLLQERLTYVNLENTVFILLCLVSQNEALLAQMSSLLFSSPSSFLPHYVALWVPFLCPLYVTKWSSLLSLYQALCFSALVFHLLVLTKYHLFVSSACYQFWRDSSITYILYAKFNMLSVLKRGRRLSPCV